MAKHFKRYLIVTFLFIMTACGSGGGGVGFGLSAVQTGGMEKTADDAVLDDTAGMFEGAGGNAENAGDRVGNGASNMGGAPDGAPGTTQYSAPMEPVDIPITVAKVEKSRPDVSKITVRVKRDEAEVEDDDDDNGPKKMVKYNMIMAGMPGAIEDPVSTPFVYLYNPVTQEEIFVKVEEDGSFITDEIIYETKKPLVVAATDKETISEPVIFRSNNAKVYSFREYQTNLPLITSTFLRENVQRLTVSATFPRSIQTKDAADGVRASAAKPKITVTEENGDVTDIEDHRVMDDDSVVYKTDKGLFEISDEGLQELTTFNVSEKIAKWDVLKKQPDARLIPRDQTSGTKRTSYVGIVSDDGVRLIDGQIKKVIFDKPFNELSAETIKLISRDADMDTIVDSILKRNLILPDTQLTPISPK
ncbi:MAG: hypothetical protein ACD_73C00737G0001 [uncultured bacterium]|nr:MAG: hypothetical protein ACD_73C00737G0001 [uncultured bacterium]